jgi:predicted SAM-dependent methyltransferase
MRILNLGCGTKTSASPDVVNIDWSMYLRLKTSTVLRGIAPLVLRGDRLARFRALPANITVHNLARGIPFETGSVDVVYHSHMLEHLDREVAKAFLLEAKRVLRPGGIQRIVVPDFEQLCKGYVAHLAVCEADPSAVAEHEDHIAEIIEQMVRKEAFGTSRQPPLRRAVENLLLGDARRRGETHQWMYDRFSLTSLLLGLGFREPMVQAYDTSRIPDWNRYGLDLDEEGKPHKKRSLYLEVRR